MDDIDKLLDEINEGQTDYDTIAIMIDRADQHGLLVEVIHSFGQARATGAGVEEAVGAALYEWDI